MGCYDGGNEPNGDGFVCGPGGCWADAEKTFCWYEGDQSYGLPEAEVVCEGDCGGSPPPPCNTCDPEPDPWEPPDDNGGSTDPCTECNPGDNPDQECDDSEIVGPDGECLENCESGQYDLEGECLDDEIPCEGNPVQNPRIAAQTNSGVQGGRFGFTRSGGEQEHSGLDVENPVGAPIFAMHGGTVVSVDEQPGGLGYYVTIQSYINGEYYTHQYGHLQDAGRPPENSQISAGQLIGSQGLSGNLERAIDQGHTVPHTHIVVRKRIGSGWNLENDYSSPINPEQILTTQFDQQGNPIPGTDC